MNIIQEFEDNRGLALDDFQASACRAIYEGLSVLVAAPTGSGKTLVADFAAYIAFAEGRSVIYTTPIKALSNQKFIEFCALYGEDNVGLATGDRSIRPHAKIRIMTTEVLRNIIYANPQDLNNVSHVILDEVHYISDRSRGAVWEEVIIQLPHEIDLVCLSATVSNAEEVANWLTTVRGSTKAIIHEIRPVPLSYWFSFNRKRQGLHLLPLLSYSKHGDANVHPDLYRTLRQNNQKALRNNIIAPRRLELIELLESRTMLPAIFFIFSRAGCDNALQECFNSHLKLTDSNEQQQIRSICEEKLSGLSNEEFDALDYDIVTHSMEKGYAPHHAGLIPPLREAVEEAFSLGLIKVVFATETLAVGVNMPAKTVVIEKLTKFNGDHHDVVTPGEFTQLTGRAGRRGIDVTGNAVVLWNRFVDFEQAAALASTRSYALKSSFRPTYNMAANLIKSYTPMHARHILNLSLAQYQADDAVVEIERNLDNRKKQMDRIRSEFKLTDKQFSALIHKTKVNLERNKRNPETQKPLDSFSQDLHAGDIIDGLKGLSPCVVISKDRPGKTQYLRILDIDGRLHTVDSYQIDQNAFKIGNMALPTPFAPRTKHFKFSAAITLKKEIKEIGLHTKRSKKGSKKTSQRTRQQDLIEEYIECDKNVSKLTKRVQSRGQSLARQFERILGLLEELDYVDGWTLSDKGKVLSNINSEADLAITNVIVNSKLNNLSVPELVSILSCFISESRYDGEFRPSKFPTKKVSDIVSYSESFNSQLNKLERDAGLKESRGLDFYFLYSSYEWARGKSLEEILDKRDISGGDFVRIMKSIIDLIRQIEVATDNPELATLCSRAISVCFRDVVELSS